jgi:hypothetical protein
VRIRSLALGSIAVLLTLAACGRDPVDTKAAEPGAAPFATSGSTASSSAPTPEVAFATPEAGATVTSPVSVTMTATNFTVEPAGDVHAGAGHLHVMVDVGCVAPGTVIPKDAAHVHLGMAQMAAELPLAPGVHKLCLQAGDGAHKALDITDEIEITVSA